MRHECLENRLKLDGQADLQQSRGSIRHIFDDNFFPSKLHESVERRFLFIFGNG